MEHSLAFIACTKAHGAGLGFPASVRHDEPIVIVLFLRARLRRLREPMGETEEADTEEKRVRRENQDVGGVDARERRREGTGAWEPENWRRRT